MDALLAGMAVGVAILLQQITREVRYGSSLKWQLSLRSNPNNNGNYLWIVVTSFTWFWEVDRSLNLWCFRLTATAFA